MPPYRFLGSELPARPARECRFHVIPAPYEASVSYGSGTADGPESLLYASQQLEITTAFGAPVTSHKNGGQGTPSQQGTPVQQGTPSQQGTSSQQGIVAQQYGIPSQHGIYTWPAVDCDGDAQSVLARIEAATTHALLAGPQNPENKKYRGMPTIPIVLGGEHTVTLGALQALKKQGIVFGVVQFDAHADLRDSYEGSAYSHACVMRRAVTDLGLPLFQVGVRSLCPEEIAFRATADVKYVDARELRPHHCLTAHAQHNRDFCAQTQSSSGAVGSLLPADFPEHIFLTFDVDAFDASLMPATGTPEPGGLFWWDALTLIQHCLVGRTPIGFDVVELAPISNIHAPTYTAARLVHEIMGIICEGDL